MTSASTETNPVESFAALFEESLEHQEMRSGEVITAESLKNKLLGKDEKTYMLIEVFKEHNKELTSLNYACLPCSCTCVLILYMCTYVHV